MEAVGEEDDGATKLVSILVPVIVGPLFIAILVYVIIKIKRKRDKGKIKTDILDDDSIPKVVLEIPKKT